MIVKELIEELKKMLQDATVAVKYRDDGGTYYGCDYDIEPGINMSNSFNSWQDKSTPKGVVLL